LLSATPIFRSDQQRCEGRAQPSVTAVTLCVTVGRGGWIRTTSLPPTSTAATDLLSRQLNPTSPEEAGDGRDLRPLGVRVSDLRSEELDEPPGGLGADDGERGRYLVEAGAA
jgi:hypothetical protein